jgi:hypothetical protein
MPVLAFEVIRSSGAFPPSWPRHAYRQSPPGFALRIVRRLHCDPSRNALRNPSLKRLGENRRLIVYGDIGMCKETDTRPFAHPYVRSKRPSLRPDLLSLAQGGGRRSRRAAGHRKAARSVLEGHPPSCDALARGGWAFGHASASHDPYTRREAHGGSTSTNAAPTPSTIGVMLNLEWTETRRLQHD